MKKVLILGYGFTATYLDDQLQQHAGRLDIVRSSRQPGRDIVFDLEDEGTWQNLPAVDVCFWLFPAAPVAQVDALLAQHKDRLGKIIVVGSTGAFVPEQDGGLVTESTPRDDSSERVQGENKICAAGGIAVYASGIYGGARNPVDWVRQGRVGPSKKYLNMIHGYDLAQVALAAAERGRAGAVYIASDGVPHTWDDLCARWQKDFAVTVPKDAKPSSRTSKRIDAAATLKELSVNLRYADIHAGVAEIEAD